MIFNSSFHLFWLPQRRTKCFLGQNLFFPTFCLTSSKCVKGPTMYTFVKAGKGKDKEYSLET